MAHHHFTPVEQSEISILLQKKYSHRSIADAVGCAQSSISREIKRNSVRGIYDPKKAKVKARVRRMQSKYQGMKVRERPELKAYIVEKLEAHWTPEEIAGRIKLEEKDLPLISAKGIYKWLYSVHGQRYCHLLPSRQIQRKKRVKHEGRRLIPNRVGIEERPEKANNREEFGHYEADTMVSGRRHETTVALSVIHERKARFSRLKKIPNMKPASMTKAVEEMADDLERKTITFDNGIENRDHETMAVSLKVQTYFCQPYHSWEKGSVENTIGRIRRFLPKGCNINEYSDADIAAIEYWLNHTPRKCLNYKTPYEIMTENNLLLSVSSSSRSDAFEG